MASDVAMVCPLPRFLSGNLRLSELRKIVVAEALENDVTILLG